MRLLSTDITKVKRLSLREVKLPIKERSGEPITTTQIERKPTADELTYTKMLAINPTLDEFIEILDLVSITTGERIKKVSQTDNTSTLDIDKPKLIAIATRVIEGETSYTKEEIIERIKTATNVNQERAERGFSLILQAGAIENTLGDRYYLTVSTPF